MWDKNVKFTDSNFAYSYNIFGYESCMLGAVKLTDLQPHRRTNLGSILNL